MVVDHLGSYSLIEKEGEGGRKGWRDGGREGGREETCAKFLSHGNLYTFRGNSAQA